MSARLVIGLIIIASTIWVGVDASKLGVKKGKLGGGVVDMSVTSWVICCFFLWLIAFPCYLVARGKYHALNRRGAYVPGPAAGGWPQQSYGSAVGVQRQAMYPAASSRAHISPDGAWWWDGQRWNPMPASPNHDAYRPV